MDEQQLKWMFIKMRSGILIAMIFQFLPLVCFSGTTGKLSGKITDAETGQPFPGANVFLSGTNYGAATDIDGYYMILNVPPGTYSLNVQMIGFQNIRQDNIKVLTDFNSINDFKLTAQVLEAGTQVEVIATRPDIQRDRTSTLAVIGSEEIDKLPVLEMGDLVGLQAGVVDGHFRGGRSGEVSYMLDGISVTDPYNGEMAVTIDNSNIQEIKVISGTFSAEYGQAMSGVVNIVTKSGAPKFGLSVNVFGGDFVSRNTNSFVNIDQLDPSQNLSGELTLTGPLGILGQDAGFVFSVKNQSNAGHLYGIEEFLPSDSSNIDDPDPESWYISRTGSGDVVPMNFKNTFSTHGKLSKHLGPKFRIDLSSDLTRQSWSNYDHLYKYNPQGIQTHFKDSYQTTLSLNHFPSSKLFYTINFSRFKSDLSNYVYEDYKDERYVSTLLSRRLGYGFYTGGMDMSHFYRSSTVNTIKINLIAQPNRHHELKTGIEARKSELWQHDFSIKLDRSTAWLPEIFPEEHWGNNEYRHSPLEVGIWLEDKIEAERLVLVAGLRYDYFQPDGLEPLDLRDPDGSYAGNQAEAFKSAPSSSQLSPRLGLSYPISDKGAIHISYGHFFQIPAYEYLYHNSEFKIQGGDLKSIVGNASLLPKKTVIYQFGLQQMLSAHLILDITGYYKDMRNLVGTQIYELYVLGDSYARYENQDYGNVRGVALSLAMKQISLFSGSIEYTYQTAEGNASDPRSVFNDRQSDPPRASEIQVVPLDWDQTHTINISMTMTGNYWYLSLIGQYGSGLPYTPEFQGERTAFQNSERKPGTLNLDMSGEYAIPLGKSRLAWYFLIKNVMDRENAKDVNKDTGSPSYSLIPTYVPQQSIHTLEDFLSRPDYFQAPREVHIGMKFIL